MAALEAENYLAELEDIDGVPKVEVLKSQTNSAVPEYKENPMISKV